MILSFSRTYFVCSKFCQCYFVSFFHLCLVLPLSCRLKARVSRPAGQDSLTSPSPPQGVRQTQVLDPLPSSLSPGFLPSSSHVPDPLPLRLYLRCLRPGGAAGARPGEAPATSELSAAKAWTPPPRGSLRSPGARGSLPGAASPRAMESSRLSTCSRARGPGRLATTLLPGLV